MKLIAKVAIAAAVAGAGATTIAGVGGSADALSIRAASIRTEVLADYRHVVQVQQMARREKDVIKLNCVNDKLVQIKAELNVAEHLQIDLQAAQNMEVNTMETLIMTANTIHGLREAADQCIGEHLLLTESSNDWTHPAIIDNPGANPWGVAVEPPAYASPVN